MFMGYCKKSKGYRLIDPLTMKIVKSRDVFLEDYNEGNMKEPDFVKLQHLEEKKYDIATNNDISTETEIEIEEDDYKEAISDCSDCIE